MFFKPFHQTTYTIDSIPAYKYGEWPGIKSSHWKSSLRVYRRNIPSELFTETSTNKIFAGGDIAGEKQTVAWAARSGIDTAKSIKDFLSSLTA